MKHIKKYFLFLTLILSTNLFAGKADIIKVNASCKGETCRFAATVKHADTGWKHYANNFEILSLDRKILATRILHHPHVNEQPFTRSIGGVKIPLSIKKVIVRAHDSVHKYGGKEIIIELKR